MAYDSRVLRDIVEEVGTPVYVYDVERIRRNYRTFRDAFTSRYRDTKIFYAYKANTNLAICRLLCMEGAGADVVSGGEIEAALRVGVSGGDIIYTSNSKTWEEMVKALECGAVINIDSIPELLRLGEIVREKGVEAKVSFRVNPEVDAGTHPKIATGLASSKFGLHVKDGLAFKAYSTALEMEYIDVVGVHTHIGSNVKEVSPYVDAAVKLLSFMTELRDGLGLRLKFMDLGGGLAVSYDGSRVASPEDLASAVVPVVEEYVAGLGYRPQLWLEPGRYIVADAGFLLSRVETVKRTPYKTFINLDAGFNTFVRPAFYGAFHRINVLGREDEAPSKTYDVAGNVCESGDLFAVDRMLPEVVGGDVLVLCDVGAYGFSMASRYNSRPLPAEVLLNPDGSWTVVRERESLHDLFRNQRIPDNLS